MQVDYFARGVTQSAGDTVDDDLGDLFGGHGFAGGQLLGGEQGAEHLSLHRAGGDDVDVDAIGLAFARGGQAEQIEAGLGGGVSAQAGEGIALGEGGDEDDCGWGGERKVLSAGC